MLEAPKVAVTAAVVRGAGEFRTPQARYPLGPLRYFRRADGLGVLQFAAGAGAVALVGSQADQLSPTRFRLQIARVAILREYPARASCDARQDAAGAFRSFTSTGVLGTDARPFTLRWRAR